MLNEFNLMAQILASQIFISGVRFMVKNKLFFAKLTVHLKCKKWGFYLNGTPLYTIKEKEKKAEV